MVANHPSSGKEMNSVECQIVRHPLGKKAKVLLCSVFGPYAQDDEYGSRRINPMELYQNQITRLQGPFSLRFFNRSWGLMMIQANISAPCTLLDFPTLPRFAQELKENRYDIVGISSILANIGKVERMCRLIRELQPEAIIVVGGHIANLSDLAERIDADHIVRGEGIRWFRRFLGEDENQPIRHIACSTTFGLRAFGAELPTQANQASAVLIPSVGCPVGCNFCSTSAMYGGKGRFVNFYETGDELFEVLCGLERKLGAQEFLVIDENFLLHRKRAMRLLELIEQHDKAWGFSIFSSAGVLRSYAMDELVRLGLSRVWIGLEGEHSRYLKIGGIDTKALVAELQSHGISVVGSTIIGLEEHSPENISAAIEYAVGHDADFHQFMLYTPLPGTPLYAELAAKGELLSEAERPLADRHGQYRFAHRHARIKDGQDGRFLLQAFQRDYELNGPSLLRAIRSNLSGWKLHRNDPRPRIRRRYERKVKNMVTTQAGALWAGRHWFKNNRIVYEKLNKTLEAVYAEFGVKARLAAPLFGRVILKRLQREDVRLAEGRTYEPETHYENNSTGIEKTSAVNTGEKSRSASSSVGIWVPSPTTSKMDVEIGEKQASGKTTGVEGGRMDAREKKVKELFALAGIEINGHRPADPQIHNHNFYRRFLADGRLTLGESYMDGWWDCDRMDEMFCKLYGALGLIANRLNSPAAMLIVLREKLFPYGSRKRSRNIGAHHYDIGNDLYEKMLDPYMVYSCGLWERGAKNLAQAQRHKLHRICEKLKLKPGHHILEIGCGWGSFAKYATEHYRDVHVTGLSVSQQQIKLGRELCRKLPVEFLYQDYREHQGRYPRIVSIAMFEAVGKKYFRDYFKKVYDLLEKEGIFFLHTIGFNTSNYASPWIQKHVFPGAYLPSMTQLAEASEGLFVIEHIENIGPNYAPTLKAWHDNFIANWDEIKASDPQKYDDRFKRMWTYYLLQCAATFTARIAPLWQIVMRKPGATGSYFFSESPAADQVEHPICRRAEVRSFSPAEAPNGMSLEQAHFFNS